MVRLDDWAERLQTYLTRVVSKEIEFSWDPKLGANCLTFACGGVEAVIGINPYLEIAGEDYDYSTPVAAYKAMRSRGVDSLGELWGQYFEEKPPIFAQYGDIAIVEAMHDAHGFVEACGIVSSAGIYVLEPQGIEHLPLNQLVRCFKVESYKGID